MLPDTRETQSHYESLLARNYLWMAGGWETGYERSRQFFASASIRPEQTGVAIDLGAGCGFQAIPLGEAGFRVTAVDFSGTMLAILHGHAGALGIRTIQADILAFTTWAGLGPELITCMGDTLTHLPDENAVRDLVWQCANELVPGGTIIISFRDYSHEPAGSSVVIPVRRDPDRIFLCRLEYENAIVRVEDILYSRESGAWVREAGTYPKIRIAPEHLVAIMTGEGFVTREPVTEAGMITIIGRKPGSPI